MSTRARKDRKRAGVTFTKAQKRPTQPRALSVGRRRMPRTQGLGLVTGAEILAGIVIRGRL